MKKLILLLLVLMSVSLHSQEPKYWEKIDFQFDSGIKLIDHINSHFNRHYYWNTEGPLYTGPFIVVTDSNSIYYCEYINYKNIQRVKINGNLPKMSIKKVLINANYNNLKEIYLLSNEYQLYVTFDLGQNWELINKEIDDSEVTDIAITEDDYKNYIALLVGTKKNGSYMFKFDDKNWIHVTDGIENREIIELFTSSNPYTFCLTDSNEIMSYVDVYNRDSIYWGKYVDLVGYKNIHNLSSSFFWGYNYFQDSSNNIWCINYEQEISRLNLPQKIEITCHVYHDVFWNYGMGLYNEFINPFNNFIIGTQKDGIYFYDNRGIDNGNYFQVSYEFRDVPISVIEINSMVNPTLILVGTNEGDLYWGGMIDPLNVPNINQDILQAQISPQPTSTKARLNFTLPEESRVSVKIYNTLGIEQFAIADDFFSEGENSIPLDVSGLADGMYFVAIQYEGKTVVEKLVVRR